MNKNITGVVMAGGKSSRMGIDKGLMDFKGKPMVQYAIDLLSGIFESVVISSNNHAYEKFGLKLIPDIHVNCGPIGGLHAVLSTLPTKYAFILGCDMPFVNNKVIELLVESLNYELLVVPEVDGNFEPLCALYNASLFGELGKRIQLGNFKMHHFIRSTNPKIQVKFERKFFININTPSDLKQGR
ncbi:MAG: molybdenum cofactor guanylyltransferase [Prolixibacteraceae bacterium]